MQRPLRAEPLLEQTRRWPNYRTSKSPTSFKRISATTQTDQARRMIEIIKTFSCTFNQMWHTDFSTRDHHESPPWAHRHDRAIRTARGPLGRRRQHCQCGTERNDREPSLQIYKLIKALQWPRQLGHQQHGKLNQLLRGLVFILTDVDLRFLGDCGKNGLPG